jgi:hypothetical protein
LGEQHPEFDLSGPGPPVGVLTGPSGGVGGNGRDAGAVHRDVELRDRCAWPDRGQLSGEDRGRLGVADRDEGLPVGFCAAFHPFGGQLDAGQGGQQFTGFGER